MIGAARAQGKAFRAWASDDVGRDANGHKIAARQREFVSCPVHRLFTFKKAKVTDREGSKT